jgi:hypothetical protein
MVRYRLTGHGSLSEISPGSWRSAGSPVAHNPSPRNRNRHFPLTHLTIRASLPSVPDSVRRFASALKAVSFLHKLPVEFLLYFKGLALFSVQMLLLLINLLLLLAGNHPSRCAGNDQERESRPDGTG